MNNRLIMANNPEPSYPRIPVAAPTFNGNEKRYVLECLETTWISSIGRFITEFERAFARFCGVEHAVAVNNGTTALHLALVALGLKPGDEVIVPTLTYIATANAVTYCGARPVLVDCDPRTLNMDPAAIGGKITARTKGIIPVHLYGHPADMDPILSVAREHGLFVLEDAAEAHGAEYKGRRVGGLATCATFSFFGNKIITTGEGGMVTTNDSDLAEKLRIYRGQGLDPGRRYWHSVIGYNYRMTNIAAALGLAQLEQVGDLMDSRARLADWYSLRLARLSNKLVLQAAEPWTRPVLWMQVAMLRYGGEAERDAVMRELDESGIETRPVFYPMHLLPPYREDPTLYPNATLCASRGMNFPTHHALTEADVERICRVLEKILNRL
jgi:perosamine synthetase